MLRLAYEKCVDAKSKFIMAYTAKILEGWHASGFKSVEDVAANDNKKAEEKTQSAPQNDFPF